MIEIARVGRACEKQAFLSRIYTENECRQAGNSVSRLAGNFAVKEAVAKSLGTGFSSFGPRDIEVLRDERGKPYVRVFEGARERARELEITDFHVSITNTKEFAAAFAVAEKRSGASAGDGGKAEDGTPVEDSGETEAGRSAEDSGRRDDSPSAGDSGRTEERPSAGGGRKTEDSPFAGGAKKREDNPPAEDSGRTEYIWRERGLI